MGKHKQVTCKICYKEMRSNNLCRHMKVHLKIQPENKSNEEMCKELVDSTQEGAVDTTPLQRKRKIEESVNRDFTIKHVKRVKFDPNKLEKAALEKAALEKAALEKAALEKAALEKAALEKAALEKQEETEKLIEECMLALYTLLQRMKNKCICT